jgi:hypothetical protein
VIFTLVHAGTSLQAVNSAGTIVTLTLPSGVTIDSTRRMRFAILGQKILCTNAVSQNIIVNPVDLSTALATMAAPVTPVTLAAGAGTGLIGTYRVKYSFIQKDGDGNTVNESPLSEFAEISLSNTGLAISAIGLPPSGSPATGRRLYRTVSNGSVFFAMADLDDITTTTYTTTMADAALELLPANPELGNPPGTVPGTYMTLMAVWRNRIWGVGSEPEDIDKLRHTDEDLFYTWSEGNLFLAQPKGEDAYGVTGFLPRRDELIFGKRQRLLKMIGYDESDFEVVVVAEGVGIIAPDTCVVIRDVGYFLSSDGVYAVGPQGVMPLSLDKVDPWFKSDSYFNREQFPNARAHYNPIKDTYELHLAAVNSSNLDRWVAYDIRKKEWLGPHRTAAFTPTAVGLVTDDEGQPRPLVGSTDGILYLMNQSGAADQDSSGNATGIAIDWITKFFSGGAPDITHFWDQPTIFTKPQGAGILILTPFVGDLSASSSTNRNIALTAFRTRLSRFGVGRLLKLRFTHDVENQDVELYGFELPFNEVGRR